MLYYLSIVMTPYVSFFNVFSYITVRAGGAMVTGFLICLVMGPRIIAWLRALKIGQYIKREHVDDLHKLHEGKSGTPTMGGVLIILSTVVTLLIWSSLYNPLLIAAAAVLVSLGALGFMDDYLKLRRKHNDGLTARAKFAGQIGVGLLLGAFLLTHPITKTRYPLSVPDVLDWPSFVNAISPYRGAHSEFEEKLWPLFSPSAQKRIKALPEYEIPYAETRAFILASVNKIVMEEPLFEVMDPPDILPAEMANLREKGAKRLTQEELIRINRHYLQGYLANELRPFVEDLHTRVGIPGFKDLLIPLGAGYLIFVVFIIVASSNSVNLTDGLDGLAAGASIIALVAFSAIAYIVSRADWSSYLYLTYVPDAAELTVFGSALLGTGLGFLWYNSHPAEVFMGDTGSLALGGTIGTMALLTKQELLLPIVGGLFVVEALSVMIQVASYKLTGKRVFRMAPIHHHFELRGWSESKVTTRFWIVAILFALLSLGTLKLR